MELVCTLYLGICFPLFSETRFIRPNQLVQRFIRNANLFSAGRSLGTLVIQRGPDKADKQGMGCKGLGLELGVKLATQEPGILGKLNDLDEVSVGRVPGYLHAVTDQEFLVLAIELIAVPVAF